jgi:DEAD/DEAH box helicase domain-containing protein
MAQLDTSFDFKSDGSVIGQVEACLAELTDAKIAYREDRPARPGSYQQLAGIELPEPLAKHLDARYPLGFYSHQVAALGEILRGRHTVVSTATSSGKTLVFTVPTMRELLRDPASTALFIYPQKALANDQLGKLREMYLVTTGHAPSANAISRYDGATPQDHRPAIRDHGKVVLTNPDMLHMGILQYHDKWARFLKHLKYVVIDEAHDYRGVFGSSVAYILRRLQLLAAHYGSRPVFISASATIKAAPEHLKQLTSLDFVEIGPDQDGSVQGQRCIWLLKTSERHWNVGRRLTQALVERGLSCLTFCASRTQAERLLDDLPDSARKDERIRVYRAGLDSHEREDIEAALKNGSVRGVFCTSAMELGIDIGTLDAVICIGLPSTMMSLWQRAGRVGRAGREGAIIFIAADTPLDSYYTEHPEALFARETEPLAINLQNRRLLCHHIACAIDEMGDETPLDFSILGEYAEHALELKREGRLNHEVFYSDEKHVRTPVRSSDNQNFALIVNNETIGEIDHWHMLREAYPKAIYLHGGRRYRVTDILRSRKEIRLTFERSRNRTVPVVRKSVLTRRPRRITDYAAVRVTEADIEVKELLVAVQEKKPDGETVKVFEGSQGISPYRLPTEGISIELSPVLVGRLVSMIGSAELVSVWHAIERLMGSLFPVIVGPCDRMDYSTFSERRESGLVFYLYDQVHDGIDLTIQAFDHVPQLFTTVLERVKNCECTEPHGCFRCVKNPDADETVTKAGCIAVLDEIIAAMNSSEPRHHTFNIDVLEEQPTDVRTCPACQEQIKSDARFCSSCGERLPEDSE